MGSAQLNSINDDLIDLPLGVHVRDFLNYLRIEAGLADNTITVDAVSGKTDIEVGDGEGFKVQSFVWDFLIGVNTLGFLPDVGDTIIVDGQIYEVMNLAGQGCWRYTSATRQVYRIHTREI